MSNYHFDEESLLELAKGIDDKGFKTTIKCNIGEDGFVESGSLDQLTKPGIYKLQICVLSDELKQMAQGENVNITGDIFGYCYVNVFTEDKITNFGQQTVIISEDLSKLKKLLSDTGNDEVISLHIKALPKLQYTRTIMWDGTNYTFSDWEEKTEEVEISINLEAFSDFTTGDEAAIEEAKKNIFIVPTDLNPGVYIAKVDITPFIYNLIPDYYTASIDSSGLSYNETPSGDGYYQLTVEDATIGNTPINEWRGTTNDDSFISEYFVAKLYRTGYKTDGSILEPKTLLTSIESSGYLAPGINTITTEYGDVIVTCTSDGTKPSLEQYTQTYGKQYLRWQLTVDENKIPESIIYNQTLDFTTSFNSSIRYFYCSLQDVLLEGLSGSGKIQRTIENGVNGGWRSIDRIGVNILKLIEAEPPISIEYDNFNNLRISHAETAVSEKTLSSSSNGNFQAITAVGVDSWGHVDNITTTNYSVNPATSTQNGLMSSADKTYIESIKPVLTVESDKLSIGIGESDGSRKNTHEIHKDGKHYIYGIGGYDGTNSQTAGVKTLQEVINSEIATSHIPVIDKTSDTASSFAIDPNKMYMFGTRSSLTITLNSGTTGIVNEYMFQFTSDSTATTLTVPNSVVWIKSPDIQTKKKYAVSIENNLGIIGEWSNE